MNDWRSLMQAMYSQGVIGSPNQTAQHLASPRMLGNNVMPPVSGGRWGSATSGSAPPTSGFLNPGTSAGGGIADMIRQIIEQQRQQSLLNGGQVNLPSTPMRIPLNPTAPTRQGGGLLGAY